MYKPNRHNAQEIRGQARCYFVQHAQIAHSAFCIICTLTFCAIFCVTNLLLYGMIVFHNIIRGLNMDYEAYMENQM